jgi:hypothetical protein
MYYHHRPQKKGIPHTSLRGKKRKHEESADSPDLDVIEVHGGTLAAEPASKKQRLVTVEPPGGSPSVQLAQKTKQQAKKERALRKKQQKAKEKEKKKEKAIKKAAKAVPTGYVRQCLPSSRAFFIIIK